jgi:hypothetical protein
LKAKARQKKTSNQVFRSRTLRRLKLKTYSKSYENAAGPKYETFWNVSGLTKKANKKITNH